MLQGTLESERSGVAVAWSVRTGHPWPQRRCAVSVVTSASQQPLLGARWDRLSHTGLLMSLRKKS